MPVKCQTVVNLLERFAPKYLAEDWDNIGLHTGDPARDLSGILVTLDINRPVVREAVDLGVNLIISHHPLIFKPLKNLRADLPLGGLLTEIIKQDLTVYCVHTNLDSAREGVNHVLADLFRLTEVEVLNPDKTEKLYKIVVFIPAGHTEAVQAAMTGAGAGRIGKYSDCTFAVQGTGTFKATEGCHPFLGRVGILEKAAEVRLETVVQEDRLPRVIRAMHQAHPYEEVAYDVFPLANPAGRLGLGRVGKLPEPVKFRQFLELVKKLLQVSTVRYGGNPEADIKKVAVCGGSGANFINLASFAGADVFLTGDLKYHEAQEAVSLGLNFVDAGHYATEYPIVKKLSQFLKEALTAGGDSIPVYASEISSDPFRYD